MASTIQRLLMLFALIAAGIAFISPADASVARHNPAWAGSAVASSPGAGVAGKVAAAPAENKSPCARNAERSQPCPVCSESIILRRANRTRNKIPGLKPRTVTGVLAYKQFAVAAGLTSRSLNLTRLTFLQTDFAFGEVFARTGRLRI